MPTQTFTISQSLDDQNVARTGATFPPGSANGYETNVISVGPLKGLYGGTFATYLGLLRWDTSAIPDNVIITSAVLRATVFNIFENTDSVSLVGDWVSWTGSSTADYTDTPTVTALSAVAFSTLSLNTQYDFTLNSPDTYISKTGTTYLRLHISPFTQLNGQNRLNLASYDNVSGYAAPRLIVTYVLPTSKVASIASSSGYSGTYTDARTDDANWLLGV